MNVIALFGVLFAWPRRLVLGLLLFLAIFTAGFVLGQRHVQQAWNAERLQQQAESLQQSLQAAQIQTQQERINQKISTDYETQKSKLARRPPVLRDGAFSLCIPASNAVGPMPAMAEPAPSADAAPTNLVPDTAGDAGAISCDQLARDATDTTLMVLSFQRWYAEQAKAQATAQTVVPEP
jgi:hypothetical protein